MTSTKIFYKTPISNGLPTFIQVIDETAQFYNVRKIGANRQWINTIMSVVTPNETDNDYSPYKLSKKRLTLCREYKKPIINDSGFISWTDEDTKLWEQYQKDGIIKEGYNGPYQNVKTPS